MFLKKLKTIKMFILLSFLDKDDRRNILMLCMKP